MPNLLRSDFILSYWILAWFILYAIGIVRTSPFFVTLLAIILNIITLLYLIISNASVYNITKFIIINTIIKGLPLWYMMVRGHIITRSSIIATALMIASYYIWLLMNSMNIDKIIYVLIQEGYIHRTKTSYKSFFGYWYDVAYDKIIKRR
jgi:hypothetical protein